MGLHKKFYTHLKKKPKQQQKKLIKKEPTEWERNSANCTSDTGYPNIYRQPSEKSRKQVIQIWARHLTRISKEDIKMGKKYLKTDKTSN